jgi:hypothetical protein
MYKLDLFLSDNGIFTLGQRMPSDDLSTGAAITAPFSQNGGGAFDGLGEERAASGVYTLTKTYRIWFATQAERVSHFQDLRELKGKRGKLIRNWDDGNSEYVTARVVRVSAERTLDDIRSLECTVEFEVYSAYWHGDYTGVWTFDDGEYFDIGLNFDSGADIVTLNTSPKNMTITMLGNDICNDPVINVTAGSADITAIEIKNTTAGHLAELDYTGTITAGEVLSIDCGAYTVQNDGTDDDANFALGTTHAINEWFRLAPGANTIVVTFTGGSTDSTIDFDYYEAYA